VRARPRTERAGDAGRGEAWHDIGRRRARPYRGNGQSWLGRMPPRLDTGGAAGSAAGGRRPRRGSPTLARELITVFVDVQSPEAEHIRCRFHLRLILGELVDVWSVAFHPVVVWIRPAGCPHGRRCRRGGRLLHRVVHHQVVSVGLRGSWIGHVFGRAGAPTSASGAVRGQTAALRPVVTVPYPGSSGVDSHRTVVRPGQGAGQPGENGSSLGNE
jgi:hypothetical protein